MIWLLSVDCLDSIGNAATLHFSSGAWNDKTKLIYQNKLIQPALINQSANDGGVLQMFKESSIGEIELANTDGGLDFIMDYAFDGRTATLNNGTTSYNLGTMLAPSERDNSIYFSFKSVSETLGNDYQQSVYDSTTWDASLDGTLIPIVFGKCNNITPVLIDESNSIYQVSSGTDCRIIAVYYDGQRLTNYKVNGAHSSGLTTIAVDSGTKNIATGAQIVFSGDDNIYTVSTGLTGLSGNIIITPALVVNIADNAPFDVLNTYATLSALQTDAAKASTDLTKKATKWGSFEGYFHLADAAQGVVTCDVITVDTVTPALTTPRKTYDVIEDVISGCGITGLTIDATQIIDNIVYTKAASTTVKTVVNSLGYSGYYVNEITPIKNIIDSLVKSFFGYYWFEDKELNIKIIDYPASTAVVDINEYQIKSISREATGLGSNGVPIKGWLLKYQRNWTVMTTVAGILGTARKELLGKDYQEIGTNDINLTTAARHLLSEKLTLESLLNTKASALLIFTQLDAVCSVRRDIVEIISDDLRFLNTVQLGATINVITPLRGYTAGKKLVCIGRELNASDETLLIRAYG